MKAHKTILSLLLALILPVQALPAAVAADSSDSGNQSCTVDFVAVGNSEGSETANVGDEITLPSESSVSVDGWTFLGWVDAELAETTDEPSFYEPGANYAVTEDATLYALYTREEKAAYELVTGAPSDWSGNYVISTGEASNIYVLTGLDGTPDGRQVENSSNCTTFNVSNITLTNDVLSDVANDYVFTLASKDDCYTIQSASTGSYYGINSSGYLYAFSDYNPNYCKWTPGINSEYIAQLKNAVYSSYPYLSFFSGYFCADSSSHADVLNLWKEVNGNAVYYSTSPVAPHEHTYSDWTSNNDGTHSRTCSGCGKVIPQKCTYNDVVTNPTTTEQGYTTHTCTVCGYSFIDSYVDRLFVITAISNNTEWGTVSVSGYKITAMPEDGYYLSDYEVTSGTATATVNGNTITVTPESDCEIRVNFALKPSCTVSFVAVGNSEGSETTYVGGVITLPSEVSVNVSGWTFAGWVDAEFAEMTDKPAFYAPGANYTVTADRTLHALYTYTEQGEESLVYELVTDSPSDWSGNYVITNGETGSMYVLKGVTGTSEGISVENSSNCAQFETSGITLTALSNIATDYVFTLAEQDGYYTIQNTSIGSYYGIKDSYLYVYSGYNAAYCKWAPAINSEHAVQLENATNSSYPYFGFNSSSHYFWAFNSGAVLRLWKEEASEDTVYYSTSPVARHTHTFSEWTSNNNGTHSGTCAECGAVITKNCIYHDVVTDPTTTEQGYTTHTCRGCGYSFVDSYVDRLYTFNAISNNTAWGTVSVSGYTITATCAAGCYISDYEVTSGTATATINGNTITVTPESDCEIRVIFAPIPSYTVTYISAGESAGTATQNMNEVIKLPMSMGNTPDGYRFSGWVETRFTETTEKPVFYAPGADYTVTRDVTLYALFTRIETAPDGDWVYQLTDEVAVGGKYIITIGTYAVGNTVFDTNRNHYITPHTVTINTDDEMLTIPSDLDVGTILYEIESGNASSGWVFKNIANGKYLTITTDDEYLIAGDNAIPWLFDGDDLDNQIDSEGYYYLSYNSDNSVFTTSKVKHDNVKLYQEINAPVTFYMTDSVMPKFAYHSLVLSGRIGVNFYMELPAIDGVDYTESYMTFEISGKGTVSADPVQYGSSKTIEGRTYYGFTCYVNSIQMADAITATFHYGDGKTVSEEYSIAQYIASFDTYVEANPDVYDDETVNLVHALADYGHYVQLFLSATRGWTMGSGDDQYAEMNKVYKTNYDIDAVKTAVANYGIQATMSADIEGINYSLLMDSDTAICLYFKPVADYDGSFAVTVDGNPVTATKQKDGRYLVKITNIGAHKLGDTYTVVVTTTNGESTVTASALSYVNGILNADAYKDNINAQNAAAAMYYYHVAAQAYKTKHP